LIVVASKSPSPIFNVCHDRNVLHPADNDALVAKILGEERSSVDELPNWLRMDENSPLWIDPLTITEPLFFVPFPGDTTTMAIKGLRDMFERASASTSPNSANAASAVERCDILLNQTSSTKIEVDIDSVQARLAIRDDDTAFYAAEAQNKIALRCSKVLSDSTFLFTVDKLNRGVVVERPKRLTVVAWRNERPSVARS
jgi:hypothetical protein